MRLSNEFFFLKHPEHKEKHKMLQFILVVRDLDHSPLAKADFEL